MNRPEQRRVDQDCKSPKRRGGIALTRRKDGDFMLTTRSTRQERQINVRREKT